MSSLHKASKSSIRYQLIIKRQPHTSSIFDTKLHVSKARLRYSMVASKSIEQPLQVTLIVMTSPLLSIYIYMPLIFHQLSTSWCPSIFQDISMDIPGTSRDAADMCAAVRKSSQPT
mmetsp:Transcript_42109/g.51100  ORF Transcript_42109/g.51100 Transcript_42109/m.51100 type:complete len:116 (-) Transcript_42109:3903-4250(-)